MTRHVVLLVMMTSLMGIPGFQGTISDKYNANDIRSQHQDATQSSPLRILVSPRDATLRPDNKVTVKCRVKVMTRSPAIAASLRVRFVLLVGDSDIPLSPRNPGVTIDSFQTSGPKTDKRGRVMPHTEGHKLTLSGEIYKILNFGQNWLCCRASVAVPDNEQAPPTNSSRPLFDRMMLSQPSTTRKFTSARFVVIKARSRSRRRQRQHGRLSTPTHEVPYATYGLSTGGVTPGRR